MPTVVDCWLKIVSVNDVFQMSLQGQRQIGEYGPDQLIKGHRHLGDYGPNRFNEVYQHRSAIPQRVRLF